MPCGNRLQRPSGRMYALVGTSATTVTTCPSSIPRRGRVKRMGQPFDVALANPPYFAGFRIARFFWKLPCVLATRRPNLRRQQAAGMVRRAHAAVVRQRHGSGQRILDHAAARDKTLSTGVARLSRGTRLRVAKGVVAAFPPPFAGSVRTCHPIAQRISLKA